MNACVVQHPQCPLNTELLFLYSPFFQHLILPCKGWIDLLALKFQKTLTHHLSITFLNTAPQKFTKTNGATFRDKHSQSQRIHEEVLHAVFVHDNFSSLLLNRYEASICTDWWRHRISRNTSVDRNYISDVYYTEISFSLINRSSRTLIFTG